MPRRAIRERARHARERSATLIAAKWVESTSDARGSAREGETILPSRACFARVGGRARSQPTSEADRLLGSLMPLPDSPTHEGSEADAGDAPIDPAAATHCSPRASTASAAAASTGSSAPGCATSRRVRSSASLKSTGPTISLMATVAIASARKRRADARELAGDDPREPEREPGLRDEARPRPSAQDGRVVRQAPRDERPDPRDERARAGEHERDGPELTQERHVRGPRPPSRRR